MCESQFKKVSAVTIYETVMVIDIKVATSLCEIVWTVYLNVKSLSFIALYANKFTTTHLYKNQLLKIIYVDITLPSALHKHIFLKNNQRCHVLLIH